MSQKDRSSNNKQLKDIPLSVLDLCPVTVDGSPAESYENSLDLAQHAEKWGFERYWFAEHHNMTGIASSATSVVIGRIAAGTSTIKVGSGGIMLPNHSPLVIAEQFGTLESMFPGRIDLGLGRAPGSDQQTARALRRELGSGGEDFPQLLDELRTFLHPSRELPVRAIPGEGLDIPIWLLGSSGFSAQLAGKLGLPFAFAAHFSPDNTLPALELYRKHFKPSDVLDEPYAIVALNVIAADTDERAQFLATSQEQQFLSLIRGNPGRVKPPVENMDELWGAYEKQVVQQQLRSSIAGSPETVKAELQHFLDETQADEIMINGNIYYHEDRVRSFELLSGLMDKN